MATTVTLKPNAIDISGSTSGTTTLQATAVAGTTTLTLPAATDTLVGKATTDTLTNKTLTGAVMNGTVGATTPSTGAFTTLSSTGNSYFATSSGNVGIGTSNPTQKLTVDGVVASIGPASSLSASSVFIDYNTTSNLGRLAAVGNTTGTAAPIYFSQYSSNASVGRDAVIIDSSGNLLVGTTGKVYDGKVSISFASTGEQGLALIDTTAANSGIYAYFINSSGNVAGSISRTGTTSVNYGSGSDYRLKDITGPVTNAADFINSLKPKVGTWKADGSKFVGFLAHEFAEVCPQAVVGEKDGIDANGNPIYQNMEASSSEVIANMVSLLQEQQAIITQLTARITALEGA